MVFIPGMMGSVLYDSTVPKNTCRRLNGDVLQQLGPRRAGEIRKVLCRTDMKYLWGRLDMAPWLFDSRLWEQRLLQGDGLSRPGNVRAPKVLSLPGVEPYDAFLRRLRSRADVLVFPYDWRLSNDVNARRLKQAIENRWFRERPSQAPSDQQITLIAHSMGGLIGRYFIERLEGHRYVHRLITVGTPHHGAPEIFTHLIGKTSPFEAVLSEEKILRWLTSLGGRLASIFRKEEVSIPNLMPRRMQQRLMQSFASAFQMLPDYAFAKRRGRKEPPEETFKALVHRPTGKPAAEIIDRFQPGLVTDESLPRWLARVRVVYHTLANTGHQTVTGYDADAGRILRTRTGDGSVPLKSARLAKSDSIYPETTRVPEAHHALLTSRKIQNRCLELITEPQETVDSDAAAITTIRYLPRSRRRFRIHRRRHPHRPKIRARTRRQLPHAPRLRKRRRRLLRR